MEWLEGALERLTGIEPHEVSQALDHVPVHVVPTERRGARLLLIFGRTKTGRVVAVLVRPRPSFDSKIITARYATTAEIEAHQTWEETR